jgi:YggT family protein
VTLGTSIVGSTLGTILTIYLIILIARLVLDYVMIFARDWQPSGVVLVMVEAIYTATDPPIKAVRRVVPPIRIGNFSLDLAWLIVLIVVQVLINIVSRL